MAFKTLYRIAPYVPADVPSLGIKDNQLVQFLADELKKISYPLRALADDWVPNYVLIMLNASLPTVLDPIVRTVANYADTISSREVYATNVGIDPVAGRVTFNGDPTVQALVKIDASMVMERTGGSKDDNTFLYINIDGVDTLIATDFVANKTDWLSMFGSVLLRVNGNAVISAAMSYNGDATITLTSSYLKVEVLGIDAP